MKVGVGKVGGGQSKTCTPQAERERALRPQAPAQAAGPRRAHTYLGRKVKARLAGPAGSYGRRRECGRPHLRAAERKELSQLRRDSAWRQRAARLQFNFPLPAAPIPGNVMTSALWTRWAEQQTVFHRTEGTAGSPTPLARWVPYSVLQLHLNTERKQSQADSGFLKKNSNRMCASLAAALDLQQVADGPTACFSRANGGIQRGPCGGGGRRITALAEEAARCWAKKQLRADAFTGCRADYGYRFEETSYFSATKKWILWETLRRSLNNCSKLKKKILQNVNPSLKFLPVSSPVTAMMGFCIQHRLASPAAGSQKVFQTSKPVRGE